MNEELKPCPFCGGEAAIKHVTQLWEPRDSYWAACERCRMSGKHHNTEAEAISAWNARAERTCEWRLKHSGTMFDGFGRSACGFEFYESKTIRGATELEPNYCPNCGAKVIHQ